jgi:probable rRNA maturation factor
MMLRVEFNVPSALWRGLPRHKAIARETVAACMTEAPLPLLEEAEVSMLLTDDEDVRALNARWRGMDKPTNVLSFPAVSPDRLASAPSLGDIALAYETLAREAEEGGIALKDRYRHLVAHGFLHLLGYDHQSEEDAQRMEALERRVLARFGVADPYAVTET